MSTRTILGTLVAALATFVLNAGNTALAADRFGYCGVVNAYTAPTQAQDGSLSLGSRTFRIVAGTAVGGTHAIEVGTKRCVAGDRDASDKFTSLSAEATFLPSTAGTGSGACGSMVSEFKPATATAQGSLVINGFRFFLIREGTELPPDSASGDHYRCFALTASSAGDALITGRTDAPLGQAAAPTKAPTAEQLPATSTGEIGSQAAAFVVLIALLAAFMMRLAAGRRP